MEQVTFWCFVFIYFLGFVLVVSLALLSSECAKNTREFDTVNSSGVKDGNTFYGDGKCSYFGIDVIHSV